MNTFVIGDIHGRIEALQEVLLSSTFDYDKDKLIILGDIVDGGANSKDCVDELLKIKNTVFVLGNHDQWWMNSYKNDDMFDGWLSQGGLATVQSYKSGIPDSHKTFFDSAVPYYIQDNMLFVHGGFDVWQKKTVEEKIGDLVKRSKTSDVTDKNYNPKVAKLIDTINDVDLSDAQLEELSKAILDKKNNAKPIKNL
jgi:predicted MPP superfamily phosphohydrolase